MRFTPVLPSAQPLTLRRRRVGEPAARSPCGRQRPNDMEFEVLQRAAVEFRFDKITGYTWPSYVDLTPLIDCRNQPSGPDRGHHMDYARHLFFESAVARAAVRVGGGVCGIRDLGVLAVAGAANADGGI